MRTLTRMLLTSGMFCAATAAVAQPPAGGRDRPQRGPDGGDPVARLMAFDANGDGKLSKDEVTDERLQRLFARADADNDGVVTRAELADLFAVDAQGPGGGGPGGGPGGPGGGPGGPGGGPGPGGPGGPGGGPGGGRGGFGGGRGGPGGMPQPGQIMPAGLQDRLNLTADQKSQVDSLQKDINAKLDKILTAEQRKQMREIRENGPAGFGQGGRGGPQGGRPGGPPGDGERPGRPDGERPGRPRDDR